jgi:hypothetical protein
MSISTNKVLIKSFLEEVFNKHDPLAIQKYMNTEENKGFKEYLNRFFTAFADW